MRRKQAGRQEGMVWMQESRKGQHEQASFESRTSWEAQRMAARWQCFSALGEGEAGRW